MGKVAPWRSSWAGEPSTGGTKGGPATVLHLFDPGKQVALCGTRRTDRMRYVLDALRCADCVDREEQL